MLHMIVGTHNPDMCPMVNSQVREKSFPMFQRLEEMAKSAGATMIGSWTDMPAHIIYAIVDAPNAHVVSKLIIDTQLMQWNIVKVSPLVTVKEAMSTVPK